MLIPVKVDRLIFKIHEVTPEQWDAFITDLKYYDVHGFCDAIRYEIGKGASEYHYQVYIGKGEGAMFLGWKHNMSKNVSHWDIKVELNPEKSDKHKLIIELIQLQKHFRNHKKTVTLLDLAFDFEIPTKNILVLPKYGREENRYRGDRYYGNKGKHGYLKVYDKKRERKEKAGIEIPEEVLTRIEYTVKTDAEGLTFQLLRKLEVEPESEYTIYLANEDMGDIKPMVKAAIWAILDGKMQYKDFTWREKEAIKKALSQFETINLGELIRANWDYIVDIARKYAVDYSISPNKP